MTIQEYLDSSDDLRKTLKGMTDFYKLEGKWEITSKTHEDKPIIEIKWTYDLDSTQVRTVAFGTGNLDHETMDAPALCALELGFRKELNLPIDSSQNWRGYLTGYED